MIICNDSLQNDVHYWSRILHQLSSGNIFLSSIFGMFVDAVTISCSSIAGLWKYLVYNRLLICCCCSAGVGWSYIFMSWRCVYGLEN